MNRSPFEIFRRNQRQMMVLLTGLSMFAFVFLDAATSRSGELPMGLGILSVALICAGGLWVIGSPRGKGGEWALYGAIVGAVIAFFGFRAQSNATVYSTTVQNFSRNDLANLQARRVIANRFMYAATKNPFGGFGGRDAASDEAIVMRTLYLNEAKKMGISISNDAVVSFIRKETQEKLSRPDYEKILRDLHVGESELFAILKEELAINLYLEIDTPPRQRFGSGTVQTPLALWDQFKMLQVRQSMDTLQVPVSQFVSQVPEPKDSELIAFFDKYKDKRPGQDGRPGFVQERKVQLGYVAAEFETFEKFAGEITDDDVTTYYNTNKERYRVNELPDLPGVFGNDQPAVDALQPANMPAPQPPQGTPEPGDKKPEESKPEDKSDNKTPPEPTKPEENGSCNVGQDAKAEESKPEEPKSEEKPAAETKDEKPAETKPETEKPAETPAKPEKPAENLQLPPTPGSALPEMKPAEVKYRELDDALKTEIQETILKERAFVKMGGAIERAMNEMSRLNEEYLNATTAEEKTKAGKEITDKLKKFADEHGLKYGETKAMTQQELLNAVDEPLAMSMQPSPNPFQPGSSVPEIAFDDDLLFYPRSSDGFLRDRRFAYWKIADFPSKTPEFKDVKDQVVEAWKFEAARPLAEKRAKELADLVKTSKKPMKEALEGQTVNNLPDGPAIAVVKTGRFTWLNVPRNVPQQFGQQMPEPQISFVNGIDRPDNEFMKKVFNDMNPGDTDVVPNQIRSAFYIVNVTERDGTGGDEDDLALKALQQQFLLEGRTGFFNPAYMSLARYPMMEILMKRQEVLRDRYGLNDPANQTARDTEP